MTVMVLIESTQISIKDLLTSFAMTKYLEVPLYQREYSWSEKNWEEFYNDFLRSYEKSSPTDYWGNILVYDNGRNYEIVDGQQRIITIIIFIHSLGKKINNSGKIPLKFNSYELNKVWETLFDVDDHGIPKELHKYRNNNFYRAFKFFQDKLRNKTQNMKGRYFTFLNKTQFTLVASQDEVESYLLFGRLNTRGIRLTDIDLIKYEIFQKTERTMGIARGDSVLDKWNEIHRKLEVCKMEFSKYLTAWLEVKYDFDSDYIYRDFIEKINESDYLDILDELLNTVNNIFELIQDNTGSQNRIKRNLEYLIRMSNSSKIYNVIISVVDVSFDSKIRLFEILSVYEFTRAITPPPDITGLKVEGWTRPNINYTYEEIDVAYTEFSRGLATLAPNSIPTQIRTAMLRLKEQLLEKLPNEDDFIDFFSNLRYAKKRIYFDRKNLEKQYAKYAIYTLNNWLDVRHPTPGENYKVYDEPNYCIEHIIEKSLGDDEESYQFKVGNLVVLEKAINNKLSGEHNLSNKFIEYRNSKYPQIEEFLEVEKRQFEDWERESKGLEWDVNNFSEQEVYNRGRYLALCFYKQIRKLLTE